jgi:integrase
MAHTMVSCVFTLAKNQGVLDTPNPVQGTMIPKKAKGPRNTHKATPDEVLSILNAVEHAKPERGEIDRKRRLKAQAGIALQFFAGLRPGEARGVCWEDYDGKRLTVPFNRLAYAYHHHKNRRRRR